METKKQEKATLTSAEIFKLIQKEFLDLKDKLDYIKQKTIKLEEILEKNCLKAYEPTCKLIDLDYYDYDHLNYNSKLGDNLLLILKFIGTQQKASYCIRENLRNIIERLDCINEIKDDNKKCEDSSYGN